MRGLVKRLPGRVQAPIWKRCRDISVRRRLEPGTIAIFGDSHTNIVPGYPERLSILLGVPVRRDSYGGRTTAQMLADIPTSPLRHASSSLLMIGTNDIDRGAAAEEVQRLIAECLSLLPKPAPICIPPRGRSKGWTPEKEAVRRAVNAWLLKAYPAAVEVDRVLGDDALLYDAGDGLHLSPEGFIRLADTIYEQVFRASSG